MLSTRPLAATLAEGILAGWEFQVVTAAVATIAILELSVPLALRVATVAAGTNITL